jgi:predicted transcriptional regulator
MSLTIELPAETQKRLQENARAKGVSVKSYVEDLVRNDTDTQSKISQPSRVETPKLDELSTERWIAEFEAWTSSHRPLPYLADDSRESIYAGRGE